MARVWRQTLSPKLMNDMTGIYQTSAWFKQMDRCWESDDGFSVCSRVLRTSIGNVEHVTITRTSDKALSVGGNGEIPFC